MTYRVELIRTEDGYSIGCPELPGCWSEGKTEEEAIANVKSAISDYLSVVKEINLDEEVEKKVMFVEVPEVVPGKHSSSTSERMPFKVVPIPMSILHFTKVEDLLDILEGPDRLY